MSICDEINNMPSCPNDLKILLVQVKREIKELANSTNAKLLCHDRKNSRIM